ncbi:rubrerythrin-like domain-containing protein [Halalkalicoccus salilacus]
MKDIDQDTDTDRAYECFECSTIIISDGATSCSNCGGQMRNRQMPIE